MSLSQAECRAALSAAQNNPTVAVEFLMSGIPDGLTGAGASPPAAPTPTPAPAPAAAGGEPLARLRNHPQFNQLRTVVQQNPAMLQQVLQTIGSQVR